MATPYKRSERVSVLIQHEIANIIRDIKGLNYVIVTITKVKLTDDLQTARIFYSVFGQDAEKKETAENFRLNLKHIRHELAVRLNLRRTPVISFEYDDTFETASKVFDLLKKIDTEQNARAQASVGETSKENTGKQ